MHFSHSYKGLGKCTFLKLCTMHFSKARTKVHWTATARLEACTFLNMPTLMTLAEMATWVRGSAMGQGAGARAGAGAETGAGSWAGARE